MSDRHGGVGTHGSYVRSGWIPSECVRLFERTHEPCVPTFFQMVFVFSILIINNLYFISQSQPYYRAIWLRLHGEMAEIGRRCDASCGTEREKEGLYDPSLHAKVADFAICCTLT